MTSRLCILTVFALPAFAADLKPLPNFALANNQFEIVAPCIPGRPWTVAGEHGALFGRQNGKFEAWQWPVKILGNFLIRAELADYAVPIDVNALAASIRVTPAETIITYSHAAFTVRQHMFAGRGPNASLPAAVFFEIDSIRPLALTFSLTPEMLRMWPAPNFGRPNGEWVKQGDSGYYVLHTDNDKFLAAVAMPRTQPGIMVPYQEHPQTYPLEFKLNFDPKTDRGLVFPLIMTTDRNRVSEMMASLPQSYAETQNYYAHFFDHRLTVETPDTRINEGLRWAEIAIDQAQVQTAQNETGMVAGYYESADSARPGYAWFFGRDTLWSSYAINAYGDYALTRRALDFLIHRQRADGKIMHEYSQAADSIDWKATPYFYASADSTPLLLMAAADYARKSGDQNYIKNNWDAFNKAYRFMRAHEANNGVYSNSEGTGWVESWPTGMPQEESYLAALDEQWVTLPSRTKRTPKPKPPAPNLKLTSTTRPTISTLSAATATARSTTLPPSIQPSPGGTAPPCPMPIPCSAVGHRVNSPPIGARATLAKRRRSMTPSAITKAPCGRSSPAGFRSPNIAPAAPWPVTPASCRI